MMPYGVVRLVAGLRCGVESAAERAPKSLVVGHAHASCSSAARARTRETLFPTITTSPGSAFLVGRRPPGPPAPLWRVGELEASMWDGIRTGSNARTRTKHTADPRRATRAGGSLTMARADLILDLVKASRQGDAARVRKTVEALAANERAKNHTILADRLLAQLQVENGRTAKSVAMTRPAETPLVAEKVPFASA